MNVRYQRRLSGHFEYRLHIENDSLTARNLVNYGVDLFQTRSTSSKPRPNPFPQHECGLFGVFGHLTLRY